MQRVSSLLPSWDRAKTADGASNSGNTSNTGGTAASSSATTTSSTAPNSIGYVFNNNRSSTSSSISNANNNNNNRNSSNSTQMRNGRSFAKVFSWADRIGGNKTLSVSPSIANAAATPSPSGQMGREAYWPTALDRECEKAARILKSFCTDGFLDESDPAPASPTNRASMNSLGSPRFPSRRSGDMPPTSPTTGLTPTKKKIPPRIIQEAVGLAIFSCMRSGLWMSGSGGSGILIARKADGTWSPPSGILLHTSTVAFVMGVDIYDCVLVINSVAALELFTRPRLTLGADVPLTVGPLVTMGLLENDVRLNHELGNTVLTYLKARGRHSPAQLSGSLVTERSNENERFYSDDGSGNSSQPVDILDILAGNVRKSIPEILPLFEAIKAAEGRIDFDTATMDRLSQQPAPGDADIADTPGILTPASPSSATFGIPDAADPDPFGIIALEMAGLEIREAGSKHRPSSHQFDYNNNASPTSPIFASRFSRQSADIAVLENGNNRASYMSTRTQATSMTDACTQTTDVAGTPDTSLSPTHSDDGKDAQATIHSNMARNVPSPVSELSAHAAPVEETAETTEPIILAAPTDSEDATIGFAMSSSPPVPPPRNRPVAITVAAAAATTAAVTAATTATDSATDTASSRYLTVDRGMETDDRLSDGAETTATSHFVEDERNEDADDEDEETDGLGNEDGNETLDDAADFDDDDDDDLDDDDMEEEPVIFEVASTTVRPVRVAPAQMATQVAQVIQAKGALVNIPKRIAPPLPLRSPARTSRASKSEYGDLSAIGSPLRHSFQSNVTSDVPAESLDAETAKPTAVLSESAMERPPVAIAVAAAGHESSANTSAYESAADMTVNEKTNSAGDVVEVPNAPHAVEPTTSSIDESDREPQTPRPDGTFDHTAADAQKEKREDLDLNADHLNASTLAV
ncbi:hypothetical protein Sste5346_006636 [Sporothrix stenoceras]|uniref:Ysc84 actin-binding domain-containing protein n=1 Tax=Sporothrix stenoceras TaxID=5173 RepID=A0ABR3YZ19_9PEZI